MQLLDEARQRVAHVALAVEPSSFDLEPRRRCHGWSSGRIARLLGGWRERNVQPARDQGRGALTSHLLSHAQPPTRLCAIVNRRSGPEVPRA